MNTKLILSRVIQYILVFVIANSCEREIVPILKTSIVTGVSGNSAISGGTIISEGSGAIVQRGVCWSTESEPTIKDNKTTEGAGAGDFTSNIGNLTGATTYYVRAYATNNAGTGYGMAISFKTLGSAPTVITLSASNLTTTSATLNGMINPNDVPTTVTFEYGPTTSYGSIISSSQNPITGNSLVMVNAALTDLLPGQIFHFRIKGVNSEGVVYGEDMVFKVLGGLPEANVSTATNISLETVQLNGSVNANYFTTTVTFEYGLTSSYGNISEGIPGTVDGNGTVYVKALVSGLTPATTYHYRIMAVNTVGTVYSSDITFKTAGGSPDVVTGRATEVTLNSACLNGLVSTGCISADVTFEYGLTTDYGNSIAYSQNPLTGCEYSPVKINITGLTENTTYHFRIKAVNSFGTTYGNDETFETFKATFPTDGLVAYYSFAGGKAIDLTGLGNNATVLGPLPSPDRFSVPNESFHFDSENDMLIVRHPTFLNNTTGTIAAWVKFDDLDNIQYVASVNDTSSIDKYIGLLRLDKLSHTIGVYYRDPFKTDWVNGTTVLSANVYYHLVLTSEGGMWTLYINGIKESMTVTSGSNSGKWFNSLPELDNFVMGNSLRKKPYLVPYLLGNIDELLLYNRKLTDFEVSNLYYLTSGK